MGYSIKDLENAGRNINEYFDRKAQARGEELANKGEDSNFINRYSK